MLGLLTFTPAPAKVQEPKQVVDEVIAQVNEPVGDVYWQEFTVEQSTSKYTEIYTVLTCVIVIPDL